MFAPAFWYKKKPNLLAYALWPLAEVYAACAHAHGKIRAHNPYFAGVPVISIGNLVVGGAGKTPVVQWLASHYAAQGHQVAIISRGYGSQSSTPIRVSERLHSASEVGDEPFALATHFATQPVSVWVGHNRAAVARRAEEAGASLLILDDGFQRRDVARDCDILVLNGQHGAPWGNGFTLPAGPLREALSQRMRAHFAIVLNEPDTDPHQPLPFYGLPAYRLATSLTEASIRPLRGKPLVAFAGLAHPEKLMKSLADQGLNLAAAIAFPDHHTYTVKNLSYLKKRAAEAKAQLVTTTKDAAKLPQGFAHVVTLELAGPQKVDILTDINQRLNLV